jgi:hypothetical protein
MGRQSTQGQSPRPAWRGPRPCRVAQLCAARPVQSPCTGAGSGMADGMVGHNDEGEHRRGETIPSGKVFRPVAHRCMVSMWWVKKRPARRRSSVRRHVRWSSVSCGGPCSNGEGSGTWPTGPSTIGGREGGAHRGWRWRRRSSAFPAMTRRSGAWVGQKDTEEGLWNRYRGKNKYSISCYSKVKGYTFKRWRSKLFNFTAT